MHAVTASPGAGPTPTDTFEQGPGPQAHEAPTAQPEETSGEPPHRTTTQRTPTAQPEETSGAPSSDGTEESPTGRVPGVPGKFSTEPTGPAATDVPARRLDPDASAAAPAEAPRESATTPPETGSIPRPSPTRLHTAHPTRPGDTGAVFVIPAEDEPPTAKPRKRVPARPAPESAVFVVGPGQTLDPTDTDGPTSAPAPDSASAPASPASPDTDVTSAAPEATPSDQTGTTPPAVTSPPTTRDRLDTTSTPATGDSIDATSTPTSVDAAATRTPPPAVPRTAASAPPDGLSALRGGALAGQAPLEVPPMAVPPLAVPTPTTSPLAGAGRLGVPPVLRSRPATPSSEDAPGSTKGTATALPSAPAADETALLDAAAGTAPAQAPTETTTPEDVGAEFSVPGTATLGGPTDETVLLEAAPVTDLTEPSVSAEPSVVEVLDPGTSVTPDSARAADRTELLEPPPAVDETMLIAPDETTVWDSGAAATTVLSPPPGTTGPAGPPVTPVRRGVPARPVPPRVRQTAPAPPHQAPPDFDLVAASELAYLRWRHRRKTRQTVTFLMLVLMVAGVGGWAYGYREGQWTWPLPVDTTTGLPCRSTPPVVAEISNVDVNVYNATGHHGLAGVVAKQLQERHFSVPAISNDPMQHHVTGAAEIRYGPQGQQAAKTVAAEIAGKVRMAPQAGRIGETVDLVIGDGYTQLRSAAQALKVLAKLQQGTSATPSSTTGTATCVTLSP